MKRADQQDTHVELLKFRRGLLIVDKSYFTLMNHIAVFVTVSITVYTEGY